jgi:hypothetical protein
MSNIRRATRPKKRDTLARIDTISILDVDFASLIALPSISVTHCTLQNWVCFNKIFGML